MKNVFAFFSFVIPQETIVLCSFHTLASISCIVLSVGFAILVPSNILGSLSGGAADQTNSTPTRLPPYLFLTALPRSSQILWTFASRSSHQLLLDCPSNSFRRYTTFYRQSTSTLPATPAGCGCLPVWIRLFLPHSSSPEDGKQVPRKTSRKQPITSKERVIGLLDFPHATRARPLFLRL